jgi:hypothetical protein
LYQHSFNLSELDKKDATTIPISFLITQIVKQFLDTLILTTARIVYLIWKRDVRDWSTEDV